MIRDNSHPNPLDAWRDFVLKLYPEAATRTYCVPPLHLNKVPYYRKRVPGTNEQAFVLQLMDKGKTAGKNVSKCVPKACHRLLPPQVLWPQEQSKDKPANVQESDLCDDRGQNIVVTNLKALGERQQEAMFILSQLNFGDYLNKPAYAAASAQLPRPMDNHQKIYSNGEADIILFHRRYGVLVGEVKSVGQWHSFKKTEVKVSHIADKVIKAVSQLNKSEKVIQHLVSDIAPGLTVRKTLFLPFISTQQLSRVLETQSFNLQELCKCLGATNPADAVQLCVCADRLSAPDTYWDVDDDVLSKLSTWWRHRMTTDDLQLCASGGDRLYLDIVSRFVGPASTVKVHCTVRPRVEVRTIGEAVAELGHRLSRLVLTPQQLDILTRDPPLACIHGPPGTGKTVLLVLQGLRWLRQGHDVHVVSTYLGNLSVHSLMESQLSHTLAAKDKAEGKYGTVVVHRYNFDVDSEVDRAIKDLTAAVHRETLCVVMDEVWFDESHRVGRLIEALQKLQAEKQVQNLRLWCAAVHNSRIPPSLALETVTIPLRSAPAVLREVRLAISKYSDISGYGDNGLPAPGDGPAPIRLRHCGAGHVSRWPTDCEACGQNVASTLKDLGVGSDESDPLRWRDVFIITGVHHSGLRDDVCDPQGHLVSAASGVVRGLRMAKVPVSVLGYNDSDSDRLQSQMAEVARGQVKQVTVADYDCVRGLERRVVVWLEESSQGEDPEERLFVVTRCTTQLVIVELPKDICSESTQERSIPESKQTSLETEHQDIGSQLISETGPIISDTSVSSDPNTGLIKCPADQAAATHCCDQRPLDTAGRTLTRDNPANKKRKLQPSSVSRAH